MKFYLILGACVAPLAALCGQFAAPYGLIAWVAFLSWAGFFATGGKKEGAIRITASTMLGLLGGVAVIEMAAMSTLSNPVLIPLGIVIFAFCALGYFPLFRFIPGAFLGCAAFMGAGALWLETFLSLLLGIALGVISETVCHRIAGEPKEDA